MADSGTTQMIDTLCERASDFITFTKDVASQAHRVVGFSSMAGFPQVQDVIDYTLPSKPQRAARCFHHSLNAQLVCNQHKQCLWVCANIPGSCHDSSILGQSQVPQLFMAPDSLCGWLLADKGCPLKRWLLTPVQHPTTEAQEQYNHCHLTTRTTIEQAIIHLKLHFRCLDWSGGTTHPPTPQNAPTTMSCVVVVCGILHNVAMQRGVVLEEDHVETCSASSLEEEVDEDHQAVLPGHPELMVRE
ncbi:putative nuclease HARBI1 [Heterodontus francisci]|uniref:putative nuclease HARBI1 n=1 Tax=Heterodontus francisci TaxID=7792 RepID=UPI00355C0B5B